MRRVSRIIMRWSLLSFFIVVTAAVALAQWTEGSIVGTVTDPSGASVSGVVVKVINVGTGHTNEARTDDIGFYRALHLTPGKYQIRVEAKGFKGLVLDNVVVNVNTATRADAKLQLGQIQEVVEVNSEQPLVQTEEGRLADIITTRQVEELPLNGRQVYQLLTLQPGVTATNAPVISNVGSSSSAVTFDFGFVSNGSTPRGNNFVLDGMTNNNEWLGGTPAIFPSVDAIQEFQVQTLNFSAEYGRNNGAVANVVTKQGTNNYHGSVYYFHRNTALNARNFFDTPDQKAPLLQHLYGVSFGGPIRKEKTFFFVNYEGSRRKDGAPAQVTVETPEFRSLVASTRPGSIASRFLTDFPGPACLPGTSQDVGSIPSAAGGPLQLPGPVDGIPDICTAAASRVGTNHNDQALARVDHSIGDRDKLFVRWIGTYASADVSRQELLGADIRGFRAPLSGYFGDVGAGYTHQFSNSLLNDFRVAWNRNNSTISYVVPPGSSSAQVLEAANVPNFFAHLSISDGLTPFGGPVFVPRTLVFNTTSVADTVSKVAGRHGMKFGFELRHIQENSDYELETHPFYIFTNMFDFANDDPWLVEALVSRNPGNLGQFTDTPRHFRWNHVAAFVQDDWKVKSNLTLNLGLRWERFGDPSETNSLLSNIHLGAGNGLLEQISTATVGRASRLWTPQNTNFAPRIGISWDPTGRGTMAIRSGFSIAYLEPYSNLYTNASRLDPPDSAILDSFPSQGVGTSVNYTFPFQPSPDFAAPTTANGGVLGTNISPSGVDPKLKTAYSMQWFLGVQRQFASSFAASVNYVGTRGVRLYTREDYNRFAGDICNQTACDFFNNRLNLGWGQTFFIANEDSSSYHGLNAQLKKDVTHGVMFVANYTFGKVLNFVTDPGLGDYFNVNSSGSLYSGVQDINHKRADYGPSDFDVRHRFTLSAIWDIPGPKEGNALRKVLGGWQLNTIWQLQSGRAFDVFCGLAWFAGCDFNMDGLNYDRPNRPANLQTSGWDTQQFVTGALSVDQFCPNGLNPFFLGTPCLPVGSDGNLGRNVFRGPSYKDVDLAVFKNTKIGEQFNVQFRTEIFNLLNRTNLYNPSSDLGSPLFGRSTQAFPSRQIQFGIKLLF